MASNLTPKEGTHQLCITSADVIITLTCVLTGTSTFSSTSSNLNCPGSNSLVGINKLAALNSNTATRHILQASLYMTRSLAECLSIRTSDILEYAEFRDEFAMQIGKYNLQIIEEIKELYLYDFGIFIEMSPDEEEKAVLEQNIQMALSQGNINLEDALSCASSVRSPTRR